MGDIGKMFNPATVALIGASDREGSVGRAILTNLLTSKKRSTFPVNPRVQELLGLPCFPDVTKVPQHVDLAVIATPAGTVPAIVEQCGTAGVEGIVIVSAGLNRPDRNGKSPEQTIMAIRRRYGMRILGPNSGLIRPNLELIASPLQVRPDRGNIAFISQSGAVGSVLLDWAMGAHVGFSMFVSVGSMIDIGLGDLIDFLGQDPGTRSIMIYMERVGDARKFMSAARGFARSKPIIVVKPGKFAESAGAIEAHTGTPIGDDAVYDVAFRRAGVVRVQEMSDLFNVAEVLHTRNLPRGPRLAIVTNDRGPALMSTDLMIGMGRQVARLTDETIDKLAARLPTYWSRGNPVDLCNDASVDQYVSALTICLEDNEVDGVLVIYVPYTAADPEALARAIVQVAKAAYKPVITVWLGAKRVQRAREILIENAIPAYRAPGDAVRTYFYMYRHERNLELLYETPAELPLDEAPPKNHLKTFLKRLLKEGRRLLSEEESKDFLSNYGVPVTRPSLARDLTTAVNMAHKIGYPVVLKVSSPDIPRKAEAGGVIAGVDSDAKLAEAFDSIMSCARAHAPSASINSVTVQEMVERIDCELVIKTRKDRDFRSVILFGLGGVEAELFNDFSIGIPPLNQTLARRLIEEARVWKLLERHAGKEPEGVRELEQVIVSISNLIVDFPEIAEMEIDSLAVSKGKVRALDARIVLEKEPPDETLQYPHLVITPYPTRYVTNWKLSDGTDVLLRPIRPEDEPLEYEMLSTLADETLRTRFFSVIKDISHEMLIRFCNIDYDREMAIVAEVKQGPKKRIIGIARLITERDFSTAEFAVLVHDEYQGKGLGYKLVDVLIGIGTEKGLEQIHGEVLSENERMIAVCRKLGFLTKRDPAEGTTKVVLTLK